jgi:long-chain-fatty-acid--CoA ligase ACSBG
LGKDGSIKELRGEKTSWQFKLAKKLIFDKIKKALGLDEAVMIGYGGGPLDPTIR